MRSFITVLCSKHQWPDPCIVFFGGEGGSQALYKSRCRRVWRTCFACKSKLRWFFSSQAGWWCRDGVSCAPTQCFVCLSVAFPERWLLGPGYCCFFRCCYLPSFLLKDGWELLEIRGGRRHQGCRHCSALFFFSLSSLVIFLCILFVIQTRNLCHMAANSVCICTSEPNTEAYF